MDLKSKKIIYITFILFSFILILSSLNLLINEKKYDIHMKNNIELEIKKIIVVGDSRMELMYKSRKELDIPKSIIFNSKSGAKIDWFISDGIPNLYEKISNSNYKYHIVFNLGVNDLQHTEDVEKRAQEYFKLYKNILKNNKNVEFYFLSVNPIEEEKIKNLFSNDNRRTNKKIKKFNDEMKCLIKNSGLNNFKYCDSYNTIDFVMPDGLHYDLDTDKNILKYTLNKCIEINKNYYYNKHII